MVGCSIPGCGHNSSTKNKLDGLKISYHKIPKDRRAKFIHQINTLTGQPKKIRKGTKTTVNENGETVQDPSREARVCSSHFKSEWLIEKVSRNEAKTTALHKDAYPIYKNQQEKDEAEKILGKRSTEQMELPTPSQTMSATNKFGVPSLKVVVTVNSDGTKSVRIGNNKMVKLAPRSAFEVPGYYSATSFVEDQSTFLKYQDTFDAAGTKGTTEVPGYYGATSFVEDQSTSLKYQDTFDAAGTKSTFEVPGCYGTASFVEDQSTSLKYQDTFDAAGTKSTTEVPGYYGTTSFVEDQSTSLKYQDTFDAAGTKSTTEVPAYYGATSFVDDQSTFVKYQDTVDAAGTKSNFAVPEHLCYNATSFVKSHSTCQVPEFSFYKGTAMEAKTTSKVFDFTSQVLDTSSDDTNFMKSTHTQVPTMQPPIRTTLDMLPVIEQETLDEFLSQEDVVDSLLNMSFIAVMRNDDSRDSFDGFLATL